MSSLLLLSVNYKGKMTRVGRAERSVLFFSDWFFSVWVAIMLLVVIPPLWIALALTTRRHHAMRLVRRWSRRVFTWCGCSVGVTGLPYLENLRSAIIVANHTSYLDSVVLLAILECDYCFIANQRELARPFLGLLLRK